MLDQLPQDIYFEILDYLSFREVYYSKLWSRTCRERFLNYLKRLFFQKFNHPVLQNLPYNIILFLEDLQRKYVMLDLMLNKVPFIGELEEDYIVLFCLNQDNYALMLDRYEFQGFDLLEDAIESSTIDNFGIIVYPKSQEQDPDFLDLLIDEFPELDEDPDIHSWTEVLNHLTCTMIFFDTEISCCQLVKILKFLEEEGWIIMETWNFLRMNHHIVRDYGRGWSEMDPEEVQCLTHVNIS